MYTTCCMASFRFLSLFRCRLWWCGDTVSGMWPGRLTGRTRWPLGVEANLGVSGEVVCFFTGVWTGDLCGAPWWPLFCTGTTGILWTSSSVWNSAFFSNCLSRTSKFSSVRTRLDTSSHLNLYESKLSTFPYFLVIPEFLLLTWCDLDLWPSRSP